MRTVTYGGAVSLDGFLAGAHGAIDWLHFSKDVREVTKDYWKNVDTILMGRKTYQVAASQGRAGSKNAKKKTGRAGKVAMRSYVFSRTLQAIDDIGLNIHPILLGSGIPTFRDPGHRVKLALTECRMIDGGCVLAYYKVLRAE